MFIRRILNPKNAIEVRFFHKQLTLNGLPRKTGFAAKEYFTFSNAMQFSGLTPILGYLEFNKKTD
jgi:hypothetical protein